MENSDNAVFNDLVALGTLIESFESFESFGVKEPTPFKRAQIALAALKSIICLHKSRMLEGLDGSSTTILTTISDFLLVKYNIIDWPGATISKEIARIGIDKFCDDTHRITIVS